MDKVKFWDQKILGWEKEKYSAPKIPSVDFNSNLKQRRKFARIFLEKYAEGKRVLELGCGSGTFLQEISNLKIHSYCGIDISGVAILEAQKNSLNHSYPVQFEKKSCLDFDASKFDLIFSLGLLDWLEKKECQELFHKSKNAIWFHSFSSSAPTFLKVAHKAYVYLLYGKKNRNTYVPKYYSDIELKEFGPAANIFRDKKLGICRFIHNFSRISNDRS